MSQTTSAISLFPPSTSNSASASASNNATTQASDVSFQETLQSVTQRSATPPASKPDKPAAKDNEDSDDGGDSKEVKSSKRPA